MPRLWLRAVHSSVIDMIRSMKYVRINRHIVVMLRLLLR